MDNYWEFMKGKCHYEKNTVVKTVIKRVDRRIMIFFFYSFIESAALNVV